MAISAASRTATCSPGNAPTWSTPSASRSDLAPATSIILVLLPATALAQQLPVAERPAVLKAAGATQTGGKWLICAEDPQSSGAAIDQIRDLNGDSRPDALVIEDGLFCNGSSGMRFSLLSKQANGQ
jgi:hypothetical protein